MRLKIIIITCLTFLFTVSFSKTIASVDETILTNKSTTNKNFFKQYALNESTDKNSTEKTVLDLLFEDEETSSTDVEELTTENIIEKTVEPIIEETLTVKESIPIIESTTEYVPNEPIESTATELITNEAITTEESVSTINNSTKIATISEVIEVPETTIVPTETAVIETTPVETAPPIETAAVEPAPTEVIPIEAVPTEIVNSDPAIIYSFDTLPKGDLGCLLIPDLAINLPLWSSPAYIDQDNAAMLAIFSNSQQVLDHVHQNNFGNIKLANANTIAYIVRSAADYSVYQFDYACLGYYGTSGYLAYMINGQFARDCYAGLQMLTCHEGGLWCAFWRCIR